MTFRIRSCRSAAVSAGTSSFFRSAANWPQMSASVVSYPLGFATSALKARLLASDAARYPAAAAFRSASGSGVGVGCGADEADGAGSPELGAAWTGAAASTRAAGLPAGDAGGMGVELSQAASRHATASVIAASYLGRSPLWRISAWTAREDADILHSLVGPPRNGRLDQVGSPAASSQGHAVHHCRDLAPVRRPVPGASGGRSGGIVHLCSAAHRGLALQESCGERDRRPAAGVSLAAARGPMDHIGKSLASPWERASRHARRSRPQGSGSASAADVAPPPGRHLDHPSDSVAVQAPKAAHIASIAPLKSSIIACGRPLR